MIEEILKKLNQTDRLPRLEIEGIEKFSSVRNLKEEYSGYKRFGEDIKNMEILCAYISKDKCITPDYYTTIIDRDFILFRKADLMKLIRKAIEDSEKKSKTKICGMRIVDEVTWEDGLPSGRCWTGPEVYDIIVNLNLDLSPEPVLSVDYKDKKEILYMFNFGRMKLGIFCENKQVFIDSPAFPLARIPLDLPSPGHYNTSTASSTYDERGKKELSFKKEKESLNEIVIDVAIEDKGEYWYYGSQNDEWHEKEPTKIRKKLIVRKNGEGLKVDYQEDKN